MKQAFFGAVLILLSFFMAIFVGGEVLAVESPDTGWGGMETFLVSSGEGKAPTLDFAPCSGQQQTIYFNENATPYSACVFGDTGLVRIARY